MNSMIETFPKTSMTTALVAPPRLEGATAIALYLGKTERWVYQARERGWSAPVRKRDGIGLYAYAEELDAWLRADETLARRPDGPR